MDWEFIKHSLLEPKTSPWFDLRIFYMRICSLRVDESTPQYLTLNHIPLSPDTIFEVNGRRSSVYTEYASSLLRRDRVDKKNKEATFISTDSIKMTGSSRFEVYDKDDLLFSGVLKLSKASGFAGESKSYCKRWSISCEQMMSADCSFLKGKQFTGTESFSPVVDVYATGFFYGTPIILTKTLQLVFQKNRLQKVKLNSIPEFELSKSGKDISYEDLQVTRYHNFEAADVVDVDYYTLYSRPEYFENEDGEISWFNAGVRVGVGIGLGVSLGVGLGLGLLVRTYQATTRRLKGRQT